MPKCITSKQQGQCLNPGLSDSGAPFIPWRLAALTHEATDTLIPVMGSGVHRVEEDELSQFYSKSLPKVLLSPVTGPTKGYLVISP